MVSCGQRKNDSMIWPFKKTPIDDKVIPPVDLNKPVENPQLKDAFASYEKTQDPATQAELARQLNSANFLVTILADEMKTIPAEEKGQVTITEGSIIKLLHCANSDNEMFLPAFTDWQEIRAWTTQDVSTLVMPSDQLWDFAIKGTQWVGVVINPAGIAWELRKEHIQSLKEDR